MSLTHDVEFQKELDLVIKQARAKGVFYWWITLLVTALLLIGFSVALSRSNLGDAFKISLMIAAATLCLIAIINSGINHLHQSLVVVVGTMEWFAKKQLGEYERNGDPGGGCE